MSEDSALKLLNYMTTPLNSSSVHFYGRAARQILEDAREKIAESLGIKLGREQYKIIFTSSATEANNLVISNFADGVVLYSAVEHLSLIEAAKRNLNSYEIKVSETGELDLEMLEDKLQKYNEKKILISVMAANNETGIIQNLEPVLELARKYGAFLHSDIVQAFGKIKFNVRENDLDFASICSHKIGGLSGIGALIVKDNIQVFPTLVGGGQERGERAGTEFVVAAFSFGNEAANIANNIDSNSNHLQELRDFLEAEISSSDRSYIVGKDVKRLPNTSLIAMKGVDSDLQLIKFDEAKIAVSNGSACSSGKVKKSHVLEAMGFNEDISKSVIRVSLGKNNTKEDIYKFVEVWKSIESKI